MTVAADTTRAVAVASRAGDVVAAHAGRNRGMPLRLDLFENHAVNRSAAERLKHRLEHCLNMSRIAEAAP